MTTMKTEHKYRIVSDGYVFRIELYCSYSYRPWYIFGKTTFVESWLPCDCTGQIVDDDDDYCGGILNEEIVEFDSIEDAKAKIEQWTTLPTQRTEIISIEPRWNVVWP